jgi:hypothetical protein
VRKHGKTIVLFIAAMAALGAVAAGSADGTAIRPDMDVPVRGGAGPGEKASSSFMNPGREFRPETWFHLIGGNVSKEGMAADLDAIAQAGISGIHLFHGRFDYGVWPEVKKQIPCLSEDWNFRGTSGERPLEE